MDKPMIGIRQADGSFYEILGDAQAGRKRLVLSAARRDQHGVRIELYRSTDGTVDPASSLGTIALEDPEGLGYQDIEFHIDLDAEGMLEASAALPGQPPQALRVDLAPFRDQAEASFDLDAPALDLEAEPMTLDLPEFDEPPEAPKRSDADILDDEAFAEAELDTLGDAFNLDDPAPGAANDFETLDDLSFEDPDGSTPETRGLDSFSDLPEAGLTEPEPAASFDLGDLDAGFGEAPAEAGNPAEDWEKIDLDNMEPMEFLDTGAEISAPSKPAPKPASKPGQDDPFGLDDVEPLELGDFDSDLSDLPDLGDEPSTRTKAGSDDLDAPLDTSFDTDFDQDFLPPPSLTESSSWDEAPEEVPGPAATAKSDAKAPKAPKAERAPRPAPSGDGLDKMSLFLSLAALSLLVLLILVLLFLNMIKAPQAPVIQPEVQRWKESSSLAMVPPAVRTIDLADHPPTFEAQNVLEVPEELKMARVSLRLERGDTADEATRRFGAPASVEGDRLSW